ncbi:hypothetical protein RCC89_01870 [Cytophagaceae bacterium ABcell3]|nr:hypothetical protein RCC89_01870 [Cytophagaceae bacterium ABcell3]
MVRLKVFRAIDDQQSCEKFLEGHRRVLKSVGVTEVTTAKDDWFNNPAVFVLMVESEDGSKVFGGARVQAADGNIPLPIEDAVGDMDPKIYDFVKSQRLNGTGELCGLWNSLEVAGLGFGSVFLIRAGVAITTQLGLDSLFALCSPFTARICKNYSFEIVKSLGNEGTFYYPKSDLIATVALIHDTATLTGGDHNECDRIFDLRRDPLQRTVEKGKRKDIEIQYELDLPQIDIQEFKSEKDKPSKV